MGRFDDIVNYEYVKSLKRKCMTSVERAAQFGAFRAVAGHEAALYETARLTEEKIEIDEYTKLGINEKLQFVKENPDTEIIITYFVADERKSGGSYVKKTGYVAKFREYERKMVLEDGSEIVIDEIIELECN